MMVFEHGHQFFNVLFVGRFQFQGDGGHAHVDAVLAAFMGDGKDVGIGAGNEGQELDQFAWNVGDDSLEEDFALVTAEGTDFIDCAQTICVPA